jgi:hypothetical protein
MNHCKLFDFVMIVGASLVLVATFIALSLATPAVGLAAYPPPR